MNFFTIFGVCFVMSVVFLFFGGLFLTNVWVLLAFVAFIMALLIKVLLDLDGRIESLEERIKKLEPAASQAESHPVPADNQLPSDTQEENKTE